MNEIRMSNKEICEYILEYIEKDITDYAILINGKWGIGKTFFAKNILKDAIKQKIEETNNYKDIIYISLNGVKDINQVENKIIYSIIESCMLKDSRRFFLKVSNQLIKSLQKHLNDSKKGALVIDAIKIFQQIDKYIFVFDDLERCIVQMKEIFGYINELVEHKNIKTILIANEDKMLKNTVYHELREKLVGEVIDYTPDMNLVLDYICNIEKSQETLKVLNRNRNLIIGIMQKLDYKNIRTLKFCVSKFEKIVEKMEELKNRYKDFNDETYEKLLDDVIIYALYVTIMYKENMNLYNWRNLLDSFGLITITIKEEKIDVLGFKFVDEFVQSSFLNIENVRNVLYKYSSKSTKDIYGKESTYYIITNFFENEDSEVEKALENMKIEMEKNIYTINLYSKILCYLLEIKNVGYNEKLVENIIGIMEYNIKNHKNTSVTECIPCTLKYDLGEQEYYDILSNWKIYDRNQAIKNKKQEIMQILKQKEWGKELKKYCKQSKYEFETNESFFSSMDAEKLLDNIKESDTQNILEFIRGINAISNLNCVSKDNKKTKKYYTKDINTILNLKIEIEKIKDQEVQKSKKYLLNELLDTLEKWLESLK